MELFTIRDFWTFLNVLFLTHICTLTLVAAYTDLDITYSIMLDPGSEGSCVHISRSWKHPTLTH